MAEPIADINLTPDEEEFGRLRAYEGVAIAGAAHKSCVNYRVYCPLRIHAKRKVNGADENLSFLVFCLRSSALSKRRIQTISLQIRFSEVPADAAAQPSLANAPRIYNYAPTEKKIQVECSSEDQEDKTKTTKELNTSGGAAGAQGGGKLGREHENSTKKTVTFSAQVWGSKLPSDDSDDAEDLLGGHCDTILWNLEENSSQQHGIPPVVQFPILLSRPTVGDFICHIRIIEKLQWHNIFQKWWYEIRTWSNKKPKVWKVLVQDTYKDGLKIAQDSLTDEEKNIEKYMSDEFIGGLVRIDTALTWKEHQENYAKKVPQEGKVK